MDSIANFRSATINEPRVFGPQQPGIQTALGRVPITNTTSSSSSANQNVGAAPPPVPPRPFANAQQQSTMYNSPMSMYGSNMYNSYSPYGMSPYGMNRYGGGMYGGGMYGSSFGGYGGYGSYGNGYQMRDPMDPETRFIQMAEESSRPAFQSIESLVMAIGNIASMLDSTFFALTSSFRAILGVAANVGQLRGVFAQFWSTFALIRGVTWLYRKLLYLTGFSKVDPSTARFNEIFSAAATGAQLPGGAGAEGERPKKVSAWPILTFLSLIFATPYLIMKLIGQVSTTAIEESRNPQTWVKPYAAETVYGFKASTPNELSIYPGQLIQLAPKEVQQTHKLLNTGWALATIDSKTSGLIPINYVRRVDSKPFGNEQQPNQPVIDPQMSSPVVESEFVKDAQMPSMQPDYMVDEQKNQTNLIQMPTDPNELIANVGGGGGAFIDQILPADIHDDL